MPSQSYFVTLSSLKIKFKFKFAPKLKSSLKNRIKFPAKIINFYFILTGKIFKIYSLRLFGGQMEVKWRLNFIFDVKIEILTHKNLYFDIHDHILVYNLLIWIRTASSSLQWPPFIYYVTSIVEIHFKNRIKISSKNYQLLLYINR